jgi:hypothetical protein
LTASADGDQQIMLLLAGLLLTWALVAFAAVVLCVAARRGDEEMASIRPVLLHSVDADAPRYTRAS